MGGQDRFFHGEGARNYATVSSSISGALVCAGFTIVDSEAAPADLQVDVVCGHCGTGTVFCCSFFIDRTWRSISRTIAAGIISICILAPCRSRIFGGSSRGAISPPAQPAVPAALLFCDERQWASCTLVLRCRPDGFLSASVCSSAGPCTHCPLPYQEHFLR